MKDYIDVREFIKKQQEGQVFCKISKSPGCSGKGSNIDYEKIKGVIYEELRGDMTFEPLEIVLGYLHYGNRITIIEFNEEDIEELKDARITVNHMGNAGCYDTTKYKVGVSLSVVEAKTYDFIFENIKNVKLFKDTLRCYYKIILGNLKEYGANKDTIKYFKQKASEYLQEEFIPDKLQMLFDTECIGGEGLNYLVNKLNNNKINLYIKDCDMDIYSIVKENLLKEINYTLINKRFKREFYVDLNDFKKANAIKESLFESRDNNFIVRFISNIVNKFS
ncbi:hypothetical protein [Clostridium butyricum]|uniref:hypothetical protein n=3 Tax=Clostridium butyricum TaxID=1492 RepID=UPI0013D740CA|nr:hypothetical protein [Clostridium butyricum]MCQ2017135.1 hypothetical protein [Clostridium butyricum]NFB73315.1 hypothetical protein [Clostridium butyricum]NFB92799.1 hypothetical protein [Clostridium butyricum]UTY53732.1 hypothetical protein HNS01_11735 [Clostridium butyricum]